MKREDIRNLIFYEIYPTSFFDSNSDGVGDLAGILEKVDYIASLGVNAVWLNPFYPSPFRDGGYDVADFFNVDPRFGTLEDYDRLLEAFHQRGIRLIVDLVPGHASETNPEFLKSARPERNDATDLFIWNDSVWNLEQPYRLISGRYDRNGCYMVNFFSTQPAFNYGFNAITHPSWQLSYRDERTYKARDYLMKIMRFWLARGTDGFRVDMADSLVKNDDDKTATIEVWNDLFARIRKDFPAAFFVAEWSDPQRALKAGFDADFVLDHWHNCYHLLARSDARTRGTSVLNGGDPSAFLSDIRLRVAQADACGGYLSFISGNHDTPRIASSLDAKRLKLFYLILFALPGIPFLYAGDEIALGHAVLPSKDGGYQRTGDRTPMQWSREKNFGFSAADKTYLPTGLTTQACVEEDAADPSSLLSFIRELIFLRKREKDLCSDAFEIDVQEGVMRLQRGSVCALINLSGERAVLPEGEILISTAEVLRPGEGAWVRICA